MIPIPPIRPTPCSPKTTLGTPQRPPPLPKKVCFEHAFSSYLNDPAGRIAKVIVHFAVTQVVHAWSDPSIDPNRAIDPILTCFVHPALLDRQNRLHMDMFAAVQSWVNELPPDRKAVILDGLTREGVRQGRHHDDDVRAASDSYHSGGCCAPPPRKSGFPDLNIAGVNFGNPLAVVQQEFESFENRGNGRSFEYAQQETNDYQGNSTRQEYRHQEYETRQEEGGYEQYERTSYQQEEHYSRRGESASYYSAEQGMATRIESELIGRNGV